MLCVWWCASSPTQGAMLVPAGRVALSVGGGLNTILPALELKATAGLGRGLDLGARYDVHAGVVHVLGVGLRLQLRPGLALGLGAAQGLWAIDEVSGITSARAPFGTSLTSATSLLGSRTTAGGTHVFFGAGFTLRWLAPRERGDLVEQRFVPSVEHGHVEVGAEWERRGGSLVLRFRAVVPIQARLHPLGYLPWISVGRTWLR